MHHLRGAHSTPYDSGQIKSSLLEASTNTLSNARFSKDLWQLSKDQIMTPPLLSSGNVP